MPSKPKTIDLTDIKRWSILVGIGAAIGAVDVVATQVIPEVGEIGGPTNVMIVLVLTFLVDLSRRYLTDTRIPVKEEEVKLIEEKKESESLILEEEKKSLWSRLFG